MTERPRFYVTFAGHSDPHSWCEHFYDLAAESGRVFRAPGPDGEILFVSREGGPRRVFTMSRFIGMVPKLVELKRPTSDGNDAPAVLPRSHQELLFNSEARFNLPVIEATIHEPVLASSGSEYVLVSEPGYDPRTRLYYWPPADAEAITPREGTTNLERCFSGVPFETPDMRANVFAWLLSAVVLDKRLDPPMLVVTGNDRGVGKSSLVQACGIILTGQLQSPVQHKGGEFEKQLSARFLDNGRFIPIDNVVTGGRAFRNERLARLLTEGWSKRVRILGQSRSVAQSGVLFALSANDCKLDADLATRSLPVRLYRESRGPMSPYCRDEAFELRSKIYGELLWLGLQDPASWDSNQSPLFRFRRWLNYVGPRITPRFGPLALDQAEDFDDRTYDVLAYGMDHSDEPFELDELFARVMSDPERFPALHEFAAGGAGRTGQLHKLEVFLEQMVGKVVSSGPDARVKVLKQGEKYVCQRL